jgi:hypothetical protein
MEPIISKRNVSVIHRHFQKYFLFFGYFFVVFLPVFTCHARVPYPYRDPGGSGLRLATFDIDATPPVGSYTAYKPVINLWDMGLRARGIVMSGAGLPIVLVAIDWLGIDGESYDAFRNAIADAAGTTPERIAVHSLHQHDAPRSNFAVERILISAGIDPLGYDGTFAREFIKRLKDAIRKSLLNSQPVTHIGLGEAEVFKVASNRDIPGDDGRVKARRMSACKDPAIRAEPEGIIDPIVSLISFWNNDRPVAVLSYYATHPQSYYGTGMPNPDFPGIARFYRQLAVPEALHVHFNGAGGNIAAGKYNDGSKENRGILAERLADGMKRAWENTKREYITPEEVMWNVEPVVLSLPENIENLKPDEIKEKLKDPTFLMVKPWNINARRLAMLQRNREGKKIDVTCLTLGKARIMHLPGELFVEYQLAAKKMRPDLFVAMAAYGDCAPVYIGTAVAYKQGGYEVGVSLVTPEAEGVLISAIRKLLLTYP